MARFERNPAEPCRGSMHRYGSGRRRRGMEMRAGHRHGGRGGRRRALKHGDLRYLLLQLIDESPRHGYDLIRAIEEKTSGAYVPSPGVIYPALDVMQDIGWVKAENADGKKTYHATADGTAALAEAAGSIAAIEARLSSLAGGETEDGGPGEVRMALQRLHHGVRQKMRHPDTSEVTRRKVTDILAETLKQIEAI